MENNYGYALTATQDGRTTTPGLERVDLLRRGGCKRRWRSSEVAPSVVPWLSIETGLVSTYTKPACEDRTVYKRLTGIGLGYNNHYAPVTIGLDGTAYVGAISGLIALRDSRRPSGPPRSRTARLPAAAEAVAAAEVPPRPRPSRPPLRTRPGRG